MKQILKLTLFLSLLLTTSSCLDFSQFTEEKKLSLDDDFDIVKVNAEYSIAVPKYMKKATALNEEASLQYANIYKEAYLVVIDEPIDDVKELFTEMEEWDNAKTTVANYSAIQMGFLKENINIKKQLPPRSLTINGMDAEIVEFEGRVEDVLYDIAYTLAFVAGDDKVYMIMNWTLASKKDTFQHTYEQIINSFNLLK